MVLVLIHCVDEGKTRDHNYYIENCLKSLVKEILKQRRSVGTKDMKLLEGNARVHIYSDVINYLIEDVNIMAHPSHSSDFEPCDYWLNDYKKRNLIDEANEKLLARVVSKVVKKFPKEESLRNCSKGWNFV